MLRLQIERNSSGFERTSNSFVMTNYRNFEKLPYDALFIERFYESFLFLIVA